MVVAVDTSRSMLATDLPPSRLERAKLAARDLMRMNEGDRMGLVAFAGTAFLQCPLTLDEQAFRQSLAAVDTRIIPQGGTALAQAIRVARDAFKDEDNFRVLVLISDGEDHDEGALEEATKAAEAGLRIFTLGVGTLGGEVLQVVNEAGEREYIKDDGGNVVKSRLNEGLLREVATVGQGFYLPLAAPNAMEVLYEEGLAPLPRSEVSSRLTRRYHERFYWPLGLAILLLVVETMLPRAARPKKAAGVMQVALLSLVVGGSAMAGGSAGEAMRAYEEGRYGEAMEQYRELAEKDPKDLRLAYNLGTAAYRAGDYGVAARAFTNALSGADLQLQQRSFYNLGNTLFQMGEGATDFVEKSALWTQATNNYSAAMQLDPADTAARDNLLYVSRKLEELQQQQQQQQQQGGDQGEQQEQQDQNQQDQQQQQGQDSSGQQGQEQQQEQGQQEQQGDSGEQRQDQQQQQQGQDGQGQPQQSGQGEEDAGQEQQQPGSRGEAGEGEEQEAGASGGAEGEGGEQEGEQREGRVAGQMTAAEARRFLDEQRDGERTMIFLPKGTNRSGVRVLKDW